MGELIAVLSGKGGTGKTSVCAGIATALADAGTKVLCIDCDVGLRNLDISLGMSEQGTLSFLDVCSGEYKLAQAGVHPVYSNLRFLTAPMNCNAADVDQKAFAAMPALMPASSWLPGMPIGCCWSPAPTLPPCGMPALPARCWKRWAKPMCAWWSTGSARRCLRRWVPTWMM